MCVRFRATPVFGSLGCISGSDLSISSKLVLIELGISQSHWLWQLQGDVPLQLRLGATLFPASLFCPDRGSWPAEGGVSKAGPGALIPPRWVRVSPGISLHTLNFLTTFGGDGPAFTFSVASLIWVLIPDIANSCPLALSSSFDAARVSRLTQPFHHAACSPQPARLRPSLP